MLFDEDDILNLMSKTLLELFISLPGFLTWYMKKKLKVRGK